MMAIESARAMGIAEVAGRTTTMTCDAAGRLVRTRFADRAAVATPCDVVRQVATQVNARGGVTRFGYGAAGRRVTTEDPLRCRLCCQLQLLERCAHAN